MKNNNYFHCLILIAVLLVSAIACNEEDLQENDFLTNIENKKHFINLNIAKNIVKTLSNKQKKNEFSAKGIEKTDSSKNDPMNLFIGKTVKSIEPYSANKTLTDYYIINFNNGGFIILSADDRLEPFLAFSIENNFNLSNTKSNVGLTKWMDGISKGISKVRLNKQEQLPVVAKQWQKFRSLNLSHKIIPPEPNDCQDTLLVYGPYTNNVWSQKGYFNNQLISDTCGGETIQVHAGCAPLAVAQVMKYYEYPSSYNWATITGNGTTASLGLQNLLRDIHDELDTVNQITYKCDSIYEPIY